MWLQRANKVLSGFRKSSGNSEFLTSTVGLTPVKTFSSNLSSHIHFKGQEPSELTPDWAKPTGEVPCVPLGCGFMALSATSDFCTWKGGHSDKHQDKPHNRTQRNRAQQDPSCVMGCEVFLLLDFLFFKRAV